MIKRLINKDLDYNKLRLQASERNADFSDSLFSEFISSIKQEDLKYYPNLEELYLKLSKHYNTEHIIVGSGSDRCIEYFFQANAHEKQILIPNPSFPMYSIYGELYRGEVKKINYTNLKFPIEEYIQNITNDSICIVSNPSSPIGDIIDKKDIIRILNTGVPVLVDEAYIEFSNVESIIDWIKKYDNLYVTRTFSKAYGSAGIRLGIITSQQKNVENMIQFRPMYEINNLTAKWCLLLLNHLNEVDGYVDGVKYVREKIVELLKKYNYEVIDGNSNWIHVKGLTNLPKNVIFKENCSIPNMGNDWLRLQITNNIKDYDWIK